MIRTAKHTVLVATVSLFVFAFMTGVGCTPLPPSAEDLDSDGDGFSDLEETNGSPGTDPFDPTDNPDNVRDSDGDGCSDHDELTLGLCDGDPHTKPPDKPVTISGNITIGATLVVDGDTKDPNNPIVENDGADLGQAQPVPNPCTVGGFLGTISQRSDVSDVYRVQMAARQTATLLLADPMLNDFDLFLYDEAGDPLDSSEGIGKAEQVRAPANGTFLIEVYGYSVAAGSDPGGLYSLLIGASGPEAAVAAVRRDRLSALHNFVEGEVLLKPAKGMFRTARGQLNSALGLEVLNTGEHSGGFQRLKLASGAGKARARTAARQLAGGALRPPVSATIAAIKTLRRRSDVEYAQPNYIRRALAVPNDEFYQYQWHYPLISLPAAWDTTTGSADVIVAVIDTGAALAHPDLQEQLVPGYDFVSDPAFSADGDGIDSNPDDPGDSDNPSIPSSFHGTHVAGTIAARTNNGTGVAGSCWLARVMPLRALGTGGTGTDYDVVQAIRFAAGLSNDSGTIPRQKAAIINMSVGGAGFTQILQDAITDARNAGVIVIAASGNENTSADESFPGAMAGVVNVGAVDFSRQRAPYSNFGSSVAVAAPGGNITADDNGDGIPDGVLSTTALDDGGFDYAFYEGTSMAAPHVSGAAALMKAVNPELTPLDLDQLLAGTHPGTSLSITDDLGVWGRDDFFGYGLINALNAVRAASETVGVPPSDEPLLRLIPDDLYFGSELTWAEVTVTNGGGGTLSVTSAASAEAWISVTPASGGEGTYTVTVNRDGLADGVYSGSVEVVSNGGNLSVTVRMTVGVQQASGGDVGTLYVLLVDPKSFMSVVQEETTVSDGYAFNFTNVPAGSYLLYAGTDMDDNRYVDDEGEAFGGYPVTSDPETLEASSDLSGLSFRVNYLINIQIASSAGRGSAAPPPRLGRLMVERNAP